MEKQIYIPRDKKTIERIADIVSGYALIIAIIAMGVFGMAFSLQLLKIEHEYAVSARV